MFFHFCTMNRTNTVNRADEWLSLLAKTYGWTDQLMEQKIKASFFQLVEPDMTAAIKQMRVKNRILYLDIPHAAAKNDMQYRLSELKEAVNLMLKQPYLQAIQLV